MLRWICQPGGVTAEFGSHRADRCAFVRRLLSALVGCQGSLEEGHIFGKHGRVIASVDADADGILRAEMAGYEIESFFGSVRPAAKIL